MPPAILLPAIDNLSRALLTYSKLFATSVPARESMLKFLNSANSC
uniref:Uncharacterized protein n=1 Tax=Siphoviridae sp. cteoh1 TaxID=2826407 RepID=A0A8S5QLT9_9CAUD|nr:MAG TPA: hypothetical protein [Siphoviridae sp. cteoh1]